MAGETAEHFLGGGVSKEAILQKMKELTQNMDPREVERIMQMAKTVSGVPENEQGLNMGEDVGEIIKEESESPEEETEKEKEPFEEPYFAAHVQKTKEKAEKEEKYRSKDPRWNLLYALSPFCSARQRQIIDKLSEGMRMAGLFEEMERKWREGQ
jgi:hypothetical protein